jgi:hypothetical protein
MSIANQIAVSILLVFASSVSAFSQMPGMRSGSGPRTFRGHEGRELEHNLVLPQIAVGERYSTSIMLFNFGDPGLMSWLSNEQLQTRGRISFHNQDGTPLRLSVNGGLPVSEYPFLLEPRKSLYLVLTSSGPDAAAWALIEIEESEDDSSWGMMDDREMVRGARVMATAFYSFKEGTQVLSRVGVIPSLYEMRRYLTSVLPVQYQDDLNTGVAVVNTSSETVSVELRLRDTDGNLLATKSLSLPAGNQIARFVNEVFAGAIPSKVQGIMEVTTYDEGVVVLGLLMSQGIMTAIPTHHHGEQSGSMMR